MSDKRNELKGELLGNMDKEDTGILHIISKTFP